jgi:serine/threonine protein kinase
MDVSAQAAGVPQVIAALDSMLSWRYRVRMTASSLGPAPDAGLMDLESGEHSLAALHSYEPDTVLDVGGKPGEPGALETRIDPITAPPPMMPAPSELSAVDWSGVNVLVVVLWNTLPGEVVSIGAEVVAESERRGEPTLLVLARDEPSELRNSMEALRKADTLDFLARAGDAVRYWKDPREFEAALRHGLCTIARRSWLKRQRHDRLVCPQCDYEAPAEGSVGVCPTHTRALVFPKHVGASALADRDVGRVLGDGRYPLHGRLGGGTYGGVYYSSEQPGGEPRAVKLLKRLGERDRGRFRRELNLLGRIEHRHVVRLLDDGATDEDEPFAVLEHVSGRTFGDALDHLSPVALVDYAIDLLDALAAAHDQGLIHRDIKPGNIMLADDAAEPDAPPRLVLLDFGLGKNLGAEHPSLVTRRGSSMGTSNYMAPEQFEDASTVDARADLYSVAVLLYRGLKGEVPFDFAGLDPGRDTLAWQAVMDRVVRERPPRLETAEVPATLADIVSTGLEKRPDARFQTAEEMRTALVTLRRAWPEEDATARDSTPIPLSDPTAPPPRVRVATPAVGGLPPPVEDGPFAPAPPPPEAPSFVPPVLSPPPEDQALVAEPSPSGAFRVVEAPPPRRSAWIAVILLVLIALLMWLLRPPAAPRAPGLAAAPDAATLTVGGQRLEGARPAAGGRAAADAPGPAGAGLAPDVGPAMGVEPGRAEPVPAGTADAAPPSRLADRDARPIARPKPRRAAKPKPRRPAPSPRDAAAIVSLKEALAGCRCGRARRLLADLEVARADLARRVSRCRVPVAGEMCVDGRVRSVR